MPERGPITPARDGFWFVDGVVRCRRRFDFAAADEPEGRGRGLATIAVRLLVGWAFSVLEIGRLAALTEPDNTASRAVLERCAFVREGRLRQHLTDHDGNRLDTLLYSLLPADLGG